MGVGIKFIGSALTLANGVQKVADAVARGLLAPANGDFVIQLDNDELYYYNGAAWVIYVADTDHADLATVIAGLAAHLADAVDAHDASAISNVAAGNLAATDVQGALNELQTNIDSVQTELDADELDLANHLADAVNAHAASAIGFTPAGTIGSTDVQAAVQEVSGDVEGIKMVVNADIAIVAASSPVPANNRRQTQLIHGSGGAVTIVGLTPTNAQEGDELIYVGTSDTNTVTMVSATNLILNGSITFAADTLLHLVYANSKYREIGRNN
jgi:hypothetical protein